MRSIAAYQGENVGLDRIANRMKNGFERTLTRLEKGRGTEQKTIPHAVVPESEHEEDWQLVEAPDGSVYGRALRFVGRPSELHRESREVENYASPLQIRGCGPESLNASGNIDILQAYHQRKDSGFGSHRGNVHSVNSEVQTRAKDIERQETSGGSSFEETMSQMHNEVRYYEDDLYTAQDVSLSRFSSCSSDASKKTRPWWKIAKPREDGRQESSPPVSLLARKGTFKPWKKRSKRASTSWEETIEQPGNARDLRFAHPTPYEDSAPNSVGSVKSVRRSITRFSSLSEGEASVLSHDNQRASTGTAEGIGTRHSSMLDINKNLPLLPISQCPLYQETDAEFKQDVLSNSWESQSEGILWDGMDNVA